MNSFSERMGIKAPKSVIQTDSMDYDLRTGLWNALLTCIWKRMTSEWVSGDSYMRVLFRRLWQDHFKQPLDELDDFWLTRFEEIKERLFGCEWYEVYDFLEFVANNYGEDADTSEVISEFTDACNSVLKRELSAYRFAARRLVRITSEEEIAEIEEALRIPDALAPVKNHLKDALDKLADRESPDYRNSIKESILAVEALSQLLTGDTGATLGQALKLIESAVGLHGALEAAFSSLYGYTSDAEGIRHALLEEPTLDSEDAKFMLVACSAFVNYLVTKASKAEIEL